MDTNLHFIKIAIDVAKLSDYYKYHLGCIAVYGNTIISSGYNSNKSHPLQDRLHFLYHPDYNSKHFLSKIHAEISCLSKIHKQDIEWKKVKLYIARINDTRYSKGRTYLAKPCTSCMNFIISLGIRDIYYTTNDLSVPYIHERL